MSAIGQLEALFEEGIRLLIVIQIRQGLRFPSCRKIDSIPSTFRSCTQTGITQDLGTIAIIVSSDSNERK